MKKISEILFLAIFTGLMFSACHKQNNQPETKTISQAEQAKEDSIAKAQAEAQAQAATQEMENPGAAKKTENKATAQSKADSMKTSKPANANNAVSEPQFVSNGHFAIQVGSWRSKAAANKQLKTWKDRGFTHAYIKKFGKEETGNVWFRVRIGLMATRENAETEVQNIKTKYNTNAWVSKVTF